MGERASEEGAAAITERMERLRRLGSAYQGVRRRVTDLVRDLGEEAAAAQVPACPEWSVRDVVAHLTGNCADIISGNLDGLATTRWTAAQVRARRDQTLAEILAEWDEAGPQVAAIVDDFPGRYGAQLVADATVHEHDLRGALDRPAARDSETLHIALDFLVAVFLQPGMASLGLGPLEVRTEAARWVTGADGETSADLEAAWRQAVTMVDATRESAVPPIGSVEVKSFELFRAITGRRSTDQIRDFEWSLDPEPYLPVFGFGPFAIRSTDLHE